MNVPLQMSDKLLPDTTCTSFLSHLSSKSNPMHILMYFLGFLNQYDKATARSTLTVTDIQLGVLQNMWTWRHTTWRWCYWYVLWGFLSSTIKQRWAVRCTLTATDIWVLQNLLNCRQETWRCRRYVAFFSNVTLSVFNTVTLILSSDFMQCMTHTVLKSWWRWILLSSYKSLIYPEFRKK